MSNPALQLLATVFGNFQSLMASNTFLLNPFFLLGTCQHVEPFQWNCFCDRQIGKEGTRCGTHSLRNKKLCSDLLTGTLSSTTSANMSRIAMALDTDGKDMENRSPVTPQGLRLARLSLKRFDDIHPCTSIT